jgi:hypothetical protein
MSFVQIADRQLVTHTIIAKLVRNTIFVNNASGLIINFLEGEATNGSPWMDDIFLPFYLCLIYSQFYYLLRKLSECKERAALIAKEQ